MSHDLFVMQISIAEKIVRTVLVYAVIIALFRLTGKRGLAGLSTFDVVVIFLLSNVVQNAIIGADNSLLGGVIGAATLVAINAGVNRLTITSPAAERMLQGSATTVIAEGRIVERATRRLGLRVSELEHAVKLQNGDDINSVSVGRLEPGGQLILTLKPDEQAATRGDVRQLLDRLDSIERQLRTA